MGEWYISVLRESPIAIALIIMIILFLKHLTRKNADSVNLNKMWAKAVTDASDKASKAARIATDQASEAARNATDQASEAARNAADVVAKAVREVHDRADKVIDRNTEALISIREVIAKCSNRKQE
jgi:choline-glycine betaine transporter